MRLLRRLIPLGCASMVAIPIAFNFGNLPHLFLASLIAKATLDGLVDFEERLNRPSSN